MIKPRRMRWAGEHMLLLGKPEGKKLPRRPICRWVDNIKMDLGKIGLGGTSRIGLVQDRDK
jgi:hypothetical protein